MSHHRKIGSLRIVFKMCFFETLLFLEWSLNPVISGGFWKHAWKIFSEDWLRWDVSFVDFRKLVRHIWASDTWWKFWMCPSVVILTFDSPSTLWSPSNWADCSANCSIANNISTVNWNSWFVTTIVPLFVGSCFWILKRDFLISKICILNLPFFGEPSFIGSSCNW